MRPALPIVTDQAYLNAMLASVNQLRARHGVPPLTLDNELVDYANSRAALISTEEDLNRGHADLKDGYGENIALHSNSANSPSPAGATASSWYGEIDNYNFADGSPIKPDEAIGHFTQLVWKGSTKVGFGRVHGKNGDWWETYDVANFLPAGNMEGDYVANVPPAHA